MAQSCLTLCDPMDSSPPDSSAHGDSPGKDTGVGSLSLFQRIFLTQESSQSLLSCRQILYHLSYWGSPSPLNKVLLPRFYKERSWEIKLCQSHDWKPQQSGSRIHVLTVRHLLAIPQKQPHLPIKAGCHHHQPLPLPSPNPSVIISELLCVTL